jgi:hypothetical protein
LHGVGPLIAEISVGLTTALTADLHNLVAVLGRDGPVVREALGTLTRDLRVAVRSYAGFELTLVSAGQPVTLTTFEPLTEPEGLAASLRLPLDTVVHTEGYSTLTVYAGHAGALAGLGHELGHALGLADGLIVLDQHLVPSTMVPGMTGMAELSMINRAIGVLVDQGHDLGGACVALRSRADGAEVSVHQAAVSLLRSVLRTASEIG